MIGRQNKRKVVQDQQIKEKGKDGKKMNTASGRIDSLYCGSGVDGAGLRCVVFFSGCNLRCPFCHNPETLYKEGNKTTVAELVQKLERYKGYFRRGGVTLSGGEPFLQRAFYLSLCNALHEKGIRVCAETNGHLADPACIAAADSLICDIKNQETDDLSVYEKFFEECRKQGKEVRVTNVLVPGKNDSEGKLTALAKMMCGCRIGSEIRFLPFRKLCEDKYKELKIPFLYAAVREAVTDDIAKAERIFYQNYQK